MEKHLYINTIRYGYAPSQCGDTLTVKELIKILEEFDEDMPVYFKNDKGYTYGFLDEKQFEVGNEN